MKRVFIFFFFSLSLIACGSSDSRTIAPSENDIDAARNFLRASLDGDYSKAKQYMLQDKANVESLEAVETKNTTKLSRDERSNYKNAEIKIYETRKLNDSVSVITYSNTYKNEKNSLRVVKQNGTWLVDLKYSLLPGADIK